MISTLCLAREGILVDPCKHIIYKFNFIYAVDVFGYSIISGSGIITNIEGALQNSFIQSKLKSDAILELQKIPSC